MTDETMFAWTSVGDYKFYPQFVNVSRKGGQIVISVRSLEDTSGEHPAVGAFATAILPDDEAAKLAAAIATMHGSDSGALREALEQLVGLFTADGSLFCDGDWQIETVNKARAALNLSSELFSDKL